ncbi:MAG: hypothetical protein B7733_00170 [Myxococcales bacterium FL481]|nr:MAG: hypothetical protein B7733_00170 [Myxococcales bacterium FL481]
MRQEITDEMAAALTHEDAVHHRRWILDRCREQLLLLFPVGIEWEDLLEARAVRQAAYESPARAVSIIEIEVDVSRVPAFATFCEKKREANQQ